MAASDEVLIKVAADIDSAVNALATLIDSFKGISDSFKAIGTTAEGTSDLVTAFLEGLRESLKGVVGEETIQQINDLIKAVGTNSENAGALVTEFLKGLQEGFKETETVVKVADKALDDFNASVKEGLTGTTAAATTTDKLADAVQRLHARQEEENLILGTLTDAEQRHIEALLKGKESYQAIAEAAGVSVGVIKAFADQQAQLAQAQQEAASDGLKWAEALTAVREAAAQQAEELAALTELTDQQREAIAAETEELIKGGMKWEEVAKLQGVSVETLKALIQQQQALTTENEATTDSISGLNNALQAMIDTEQAARQEFAHLTQDQREHVDLLTQKMLEQGASFEKVAEAAHLTAPALRLLKDEQEGIREATEGATGWIQKFWQTWVVGIDKSGTASVAWAMQMSQAIDEVRKAIGHAITAFPDMIRAAADAGDNLKSMGDRLEMTAAQVRELQYVSQLSGVNMQLMAKSTQTLGVELNKAGSNARQAVQSIGLVPETLAQIGQKDGAVAQLSEIVKQIKATVPAGQQGAKMIEIFGNRAQQMTGLLRENLPGIHEEFANLVDEEAINRAGELGDAFNDNLAKINLVMEESKRQWTNAFLDPINEILELMPNLGGTILSLGGMFQSVATASIPLVTNLVILSGNEGLGGVAKLAGKAATSIKEFGTGMAESVATGFSSFYQGVKQIQTSAVSLTESLLDAAGRGVKGFVEGFKNLPKTVSGAFGTVMEAVKGFGPKFKEIASTLVDNFGKGFDAVKTAAKSIGPALTEAQKHFSGLATKGLDFIKNMGGVSGAFGLLKEGALSFAGGLKTLATQVIPNLIKQIVTMNVALLTNPFVLIGASIVALGVIIYKAVKNWEPIKQFFSDLWVITKALFGDLIGWFKSSGDSAGGFSKAIETVVGWAKFLWGWWGKIIDQLKQFPILAQYIQMWEFAIEKVVKAAKWLGDKIAWIIGLIHKQAEEQRKADADEAARQKAIQDKIDQEAAYQASLVKTKSALDQKNAAIAKGEEAFKALNAAQKKQIEDLDVKGGANAKEIVELMGAQIKGADGVTVGIEAATIAVQMYLDSLKEAKKEGAKDPGKKLAEDAKELAVALRQATVESVPLNDQLEQFGKKADEIVDRAALRGELKKIDAAIIATAQAFNQSQLAEKMKEINEKAAEAAKTFSEKTAEGAREAVTAIGAMQAEIDSAYMTEDAKRLQAIEREQAATLQALQVKRDAEMQRAAERMAAIDAEAAATLKAEQDALQAGQTLSAQRIQQITDGRDAAVNAVEKETAVVLAKLKEQGVGAEKLAQHKKEMAEKATKDAELNARLVGAITKKLIAEQIADEETKLQKMIEAGDQVSEAQIIQQAALVEIKKKGLDQIDADSKTAAQAELFRQMDMLAKMKRLVGEYSDFQIKEKERVVARLKQLEGDPVEARLKELGVKSKAAAKIQLDEEVAKLKELEGIKDQLAAGEYARQQKIVEDSKRAAGEFVADWGQGLDEISRAFEQLANIAGESFGGILKSVGEAFGQLKLMKTGLGEMKKGFAAFGEKGGIGGVFDSASKGASGLMGGIKGVMGVVGTAMPMIGGMVAAATAAVAVGKKMWDAFTSSEGEKAAKDISRAFKDVEGKALKVSEEFGNKLAATAKDLFKGDRWAAEVFHLNDIIKEAGGLSEKNFSEFAGRLNNTFDMLAQGKFTVEQATKALDENFGAFAEHVVKSGKLASKEFQEIIKRNAEAGTNSKAVTDFVLSQTDRLSTNLSKMVDAATAPVLSTKDMITKFSAEGRKQLEEDYKAAQKSSDKFTGTFEEFVDQQAEFYNTLEEGDKRLKTVFFGDDLELWNKRKELTKKAGEDMARLERLTLASFNASIKSGASYLDALEKMSPTLDKLIDGNKKLGREGSEAIGELLHFRQIARDNKELVESTGALNEVMLALSNIGGLTTETMADLQLQGKQTFDDLVKAGFTEKQALQQMKPFLESVRQAHVDMGLPIDENTQALIAQAEQEGVLAKQKIETNDILKEGLGALIEAVGGKLPEAWKKAQDAALEAAKKAAAAGSVAAKAVGGVGNAADGVADSLDNTDWEGWSQEAIDAAKAAQDAVDGVSLGSSPGGIKEIPIKLNEAIRKFREWERTGVSASEAVRAAVEGVEAGDMAVHRMQQAAQEAGGVTGLGDMGQVERQLETLGQRMEDLQAMPTPIMFEIKAMDGADVKRVVEDKIQPALMDAWKRGRGITDLRELIPTR